MSARDDRGQLLLLAGIVLVIAFVVTALTLSNLSQLEKEASEDQNDRILADYRFIREKTGSTLSDVVTRDTKKETLLDAFETLSGSLRVLAHEKGYDLVMKVAGRAETLDRSEWSYTQDGFPLRDAGTPQIDPGDGSPSTEIYHWRAYNNTVVLEAGALSPTNRWRYYDGTNDGIMHTKPCNKAENQLAAGPPAGWTTCIKGIIVYIYMADATTTIEEFVVYGFNANAPAGT